ncbi:MAG: sodium:proton antiporter [Pseudomonadota bacterium]|nr:sodium:proton antiporter [Pseudomonadota bacterium]
MTESVITSLVFVVALGIAAQWLAWRLKIPAIILLMALGLLVGPALGWVQPVAEFGTFLPALIALSVAIILFEGGMSLRLHEYKEAGVDVTRLVTLGLPITWGMSSSAAHWIGGLSWPVALIFGAITVVTGPTVIIPLLKHARLKRRPAALLKWEGIVNDPIGALLAVLVFEYFVTSESGGFASDVVVTLLLVLALAGVLGAAVGYGLGWMFRRGHVPEYLKSPLMLASVLAVYVVANHIHGEAGLMAVTVAGVVLANQSLRSIDELRRFKEYITIILVSVLFIILAAKLEVATLAYLDWRSAALLAMVIFVVRPVSVYLATIGTGINWRERLLIAWIAPRGIVAASVAGLFGPALVAAGYIDGKQLLPLVFCLIAVTVVLHGATLGPLARRLGLAADQQGGLLIVGASPWSTELAKALGEAGINVVINDNRWSHLRAARMGGLPVYYGSLLAEHVEQDYELNEISQLLAVSDNDSYNALVCTRFGPELGRTNVFQLPYGEQEERHKMTKSMRGQIAFGDEWVFDELMRLHYQGWQMRRTTLREDFSFEQFSEQLPEQALLMALITPKKQLQFFPKVDVATIKSGSIVISYQPENGSKG